MNDRLISLGRRLLRTLEALRTRLDPLTRRLLGPTVADEAGGRTVTSYDLEADELLSRESTARAQRIVRAAVLVIVLLIVWSAFAPIDEVTRGDGKVIPSRQLQVVQSLDGGVVSEILVREGQEVESGQLLLRIDVTRATSGVRESASQTFSLQVRRARLKALAEGSPFLPPTAPANDLEAQRTIDEERNLYQARVSELAAMVSINRQQLMQREQELSEARSRRSSAQRSLDISRQELAKTRPLLKSGAISEVEVLRIERDVSRASGEVEQTGAQIARVQAAIGEAQRKITETELSFRNEARKEMSDVLARLNALNEGAVALADKVDKAQVKSPVRGRVQRLLANTVGGVVQPGKDIVEIVPLDDALVLEARVQPKDIAFIHPGQPATVKFSAYDFSIYGGLSAKVENISPDTQVDERGNAFYVVRVRTDTVHFSEQQPIIPGMTAEVDILTGKKTVLSYLLKPVLKAKAYALRER
ncbi:HlyD family type I secretion periplasmic adaptor subunit [Sphaerotilus microaerophilus]|uniref:Membrane fusion protein (MFP) family protein n=1 Tax=Sphaerotilus microaerophilus TaxID=2914710 RepID=A0ABM7YPR6_9BURK|nr:HlyD family type I secretion periplasmic adaptor subunit [Sphaerotilus sp. FB-5]BDI06496.1 HlyD family type I secretion periplasmic adaptor subunit [Sphaerotilus sp. FB-5]